MLPDSVPQLVYKILRPSEFESATVRGHPDTADDVRDGFVHLSSCLQLAGTLAAHFNDADEVMLLEFAAALLRPELKWEASRGGEMFPHFYGALSISKAQRQWRLVRTRDGTFQLPEDLKP